MAARQLCARSLACAVAGAALFGCDSKAEKPGTALAEIASAKPSLMGTPQPPAQPPPPSSVPIQPAARLPASPADLLLTPERRSALEQAFAQAAGFLDVTELETELYALELSRGKEAAAVAAFDQRARGKWVLFTGNMVEPTKDSFKMPVRYTARDATDPLGVTSQWFSVELSDIQGYDPSEYRHGEMAAVLARYKGQKRAAPGYDVILLRRWFVGGAK